MGGLQTTEGSSNSKVTLFYDCLSINQSIKLLYHQYPRRSQTQWCNSQIGVQIQSRRGYSVTSTGRWAHRCLREKAKSKRYVLKSLLKVATEVAERTDSGRLFQSEGAHEMKALAPVLVFILGTDRVTICPPKPISNLESLKGQF